MCLSGLWTGSGARCTAGLAVAPRHRPERILRFAGPPAAGSRRMINASPNAWLGDPMHTPRGGFAGSASHPPPICTSLCKPRRLWEAFGFLGYWASWSRCPHLRSRSVGGRAEA